MKRHNLLTKLMAAAAAFELWRASVVRSLNDPGPLCARWLCCSRLSIAALAYVLIATGTSLCTGSTPGVIRTEALKPSVGETGRPLPLSGHWHANNRPLALQVQMIKEGRYILPFLEYPRNVTGEAAAYREQMAAPMQQIRKWGLPIVIRGTQYESILYSDRECWRYLPPEQSPLVWPVESEPVRVDAEQLRERGVPESQIAYAVKHGVETIAAVSPVGAVEPWRECGGWWTNQGGLRVLQELYPDPPLIIFLSNNEASRYRPDRGHTSRRLETLVAAGHDREEAISAGYIERYRALQEGMRAGLKNAIWRRNARFVAYNSFAPPHLGRYPTTYTEKYGFGGTRMWDGGMPECYDNPWEPEKSDHTLFSMQVSCMNWPFVQRRVFERNPNYWFEVIYWDGGSPNGGKPNFYVRQGQVVSPERYRGWCQFVLWLTRPRVSREFRGSAQKNDAMTWPYWEALLDMVDLVHNEPVLAQFWRHGELVPNTAHRHPYQKELPEALKDEQRWFLLDCDCHPDLYDGTYYDFYSLDRSPMRGKWDRFRREYAHIPVYALALSRGQAPKCEWLVYAHAPRGARANVGVTIPEYGDVKLARVTRSGSFYHVRQQGNSVTCIHVGGPDEPPVQTSPERAVPPDPSLVFDLPLNALEGPPRPYELLGDELLYWRRTSDVSGPGRSVAVAGGAAVVADRDRGKVLQLDGKTGRLLLPPCRSLNIEPVTQRTISFWFKPAHVTGRQFLVDIGCHGWWLKPHGRAGFSIYLDGDTLYAGAYAAEWAEWLKYEGIAADQWRHVTLVLDAPDERVRPNRMHLYVDGKKVASAPARSLPPHRGGSSEAELMLGSNGRTVCHDGPIKAKRNLRDPDRDTVYDFQGCLDEVRIQNNVAPPDGR